MLVFTSLMTAITVWSDTHIVTKRMTSAFVSEATFYCALAQMRKTPRQDNHRAYGASYDLCLFVQVGKS
jgi:hypothetical protein